MHFDSKVWASLILLFQLTPFWKCPQRANYKTPGDSIKTLIYGIFFARNDFFLNLIIFPLHISEMGFLSKTPLFDVRS